MQEIIKAVNAVMKAIGYVQKDGAISQGGNYKYVSHDAVVKAVRPHMVENGLSIYPSRTEITNSEIYENANKKLQHKVDFVITFTLAHISGETLDIQVPACGIDFGDKHTGKAMSYAKKYALSHLFLLETGVDADTTSSTLQERAKYETTKTAANEWPEEVCKEVERGMMMEGREFTVAWLELTGFKPNQITKEKAYQLSQVYSLVSSDVMFKTHTPYAIMQEAIKRIKETNK